MLKLVRREKSTEDRRRVHVTLTAKGRGLLEKLYRVHRAELATVGPRLIGLLQKASSEVPAKSPGYSSPACFLPEIED